MPLVITKNQSFGVRKGSVWCNDREHRCNIGGLLSVKLGNYKCMVGEQIGVNLGNEKIKGVTMGNDIYVTILPCQEIR